LATQTSPEAQVPSGWQGADWVLRFESGWELHAAKQTDITIRKTNIPRIKRLSFGADQAKPRAKGILRQRQAFGKDDEFAKCAVAQIW
jgi:hypothetical protein